MAFKSLTESLSAQGGRHAVNNNPVTMYGHSTADGGKHITFSFSKAFCSKMRWPIGTNVDIMLDESNKMIRIEKCAQGRWRILSPKGKVDIGVMRGGAVKIKCRGPLFDVYPDVVTYLGDRDIIIEDGGVNFCYPEPAVKMANIPRMNGKAQPDRM